VAVHTKRKTVMILGIYGGSLKVSHPCVHPFLVRPSQRHCKGFRGQCAPKGMDRVGSKERVGAQSTKLKGLAPESLPVPVCVRLPETSWLTSKSRRATSNGSSVVHPPATEIL
jgi:hypothetical protein